MYKVPCVYIVTNRPNGTLYIGVTSNLPARIWHHKNKSVRGFTARYNLERLVWFEAHESMGSAIAREKPLKGGSRAKKIALVKAMNPDWRDLYGTIL